MKNGPLVSFLAPVYNAKPAYLEALVHSLRAQRAGSWELILADDHSSDSATRSWLDRHAKNNDIVILRLERNLGIAGATNAALTRARAPWVGLIDHDDALTPHTLDMIGEALARHPDAQFIHTDEVICDEALNPIEIFLKPVFDPVMLSGVNYLNHLSLYRRDRLLALGGLREGFEGSQDYDLALRYTAGLSDAQRLHLPYPAYLWRRDGGSYSAIHAERSKMNARKALAEAYARDGVAPQIDDALGAGLHRLRFGGARPLVSVVIPSRNGLELISRALEGLVEKTRYPTMEIIVVDNGSDDPEVLALYERMATNDRIPFEARIEPEPFSFARAINKGVARARGPFVLLLNNDVEILQEDWLDEMVECFAYPDVGVVGAKLLYPDRTIQHAGVIVGFGGLAGHWYLRAPENFPGPLGRLWVRQSLSCVTGACLLTTKETFQAAGGFDETNFAVAYNDVDYCLRVLSIGRRIVWTPFAALVHHESATRGSDETPENIERFRAEQDRLRERHRTDVYDDRAINPWFSKDRSTPVFAGAPVLFDAR